MSAAPGHAMDSAGAKSVMSNNMKELHEGKEEISNVIRGHKANLSNPSEYLLKFHIPLSSSLKLRAYQLT
jgi:hypothetical protein